MKAFFGTRRVEVAPDPRSLAERILDRLFNKRVIVNCDRDPYLHRWFVIRLPWLGVFIHKFVRSDEDRALHDHPWPFIVIPIWRGYVEHNLRKCEECNGIGYGLLVNDCPACGGECVQPNRTRVYPILGTRMRPATYRHRVLLFEREVSPQTVAICGPVNPCLPSWSIFIRFQKIRDWGFWLPGGFKQWSDFWKEKCE